MEIKLRSDTLIGSAEGYGNIIDTDIVYDEIGIPYIPSKRIKGILLDSAIELNEMLNDVIEIKSIFGETGTIQGNMKIGNFFIKDYAETKEWLKYLKTKSILINKNNVLKYFTNVRNSTAIDKKTGLAQEHSLRTERVLNKNNIFLGEVEIHPDFANQLALICQNIKRIGTKRTRGLGEVELHFKQNGNIINDSENIETLVEEVCNENN